jgi:hypothetical protein
LFERYAGQRIRQRAPRITDVEPAEGPPGTAVTIRGYNLAGASVAFGPYEAIVLEDGTDELRVRVPDDARPVVPFVARLRGLRRPVERVGNGRSRLRRELESPAETPSEALRGEAGRAGADGRRLDVIVANGPAVDVRQGGFTLTRPPASAETSYRFSAPRNQVITPSGTDQRYLVLMVLPNDQSIPAGLTAADLAADLDAKLAADDDSADSFWQEASYGKTSFEFDVFDQVIDLDKDWFDYYHGAAPRRIDAAGVTYPHTFAGGETLDVASDGLSVLVTFDAGEYTLADAVDEINDAVTAAATADGVDETLVAVANDGQLRLESVEAGAGATLTVEGGTAVEPLGLDVATVSSGVDRLDDGFQLGIEALEKRVETLSDAAADSLLSGYDGYIVSHAVDEEFDYLRAYASIGAWTFNVRGKSYAYGFVHITSGYQWEVFAHEIGHNLGFPDLYDEPGEPELVGRELGSWDIMHASRSNSHPSAWIKAHKSHRPGSTEPGYDSPWMDPGDVAVVFPPAAGATRTEQFLVFPTSAEVPAINPFASSHPGVPLVHAVRMQLQSNHNVYVEARERPFSDPTLGEAAYDAGIPEEGLIVSDAIDDLTGLPIFRANATLLTPYADPLDVAGELLSEPLTATNTLTVECQEVIGEDPAVYLVEVVWGQGDYYDLRIDTWSPPPWESPDIWIDTEVDNGWDEYVHSSPSDNPDVAGNPVANGDRSRVGWPSRVYARVWNDGTEPATDVVVRFGIVIPAGTGGSAEIGTDVIEEIQPGEFGLAMVEWTPRDDNEGHVCLTADVIHQSGELNASNNTAQENVTDWFLERGSPYQPVEFTVQVQNPLPRREQFHVEVEGLRPGYHVEVDPVEFWLDPGEVKTPTAKITADDWVPTDAELRKEEQDPPVVSFRFDALYGCMYAPVGGLSGTVHAVDRADVDVKFERIDEAESIAIVNATADGTPVRGANVTVRLTHGEAADEDGDVVDLGRARTDNHGRAEVRVRRSATATAPAPSSGQDDAYEATVVVSPTLGTGPAETTVDVPFVGG